MRIARFTDTLHTAAIAALDGGAAPALAAVTTFAATGITDPRYGLVFTTGPGAELGLQFVGTARDGGEDFTAGEPPPVRGPGPARAPAPVLAAARGKLRLADLDDWLAALVTDTFSGGPDGGPDGGGELARVTLISADPGYHHRRGLRIRFHDGSAAYGLWRHARPPGASAPGELFTVPEVV